MTALEADPGARDLVLAATADPVRLVRVRAAAALAAVDPATVPEPARAALVAARDEHERSLLARPDDFASQYNLGNLHLERGDPAAAAERYRKALTLRPDHVASLVNLSMAEARLGRMAEAEAALREAIRLQPREAAAHFNLGLLLAETQRPAEAREALQRAVELDPQSAGAAVQPRGARRRHEPEEGRGARRPCRRARAAGPALRLHAGVLPPEVRRRGRARSAFCARSSPGTPDTATAGRSSARCSRSEDAPPRRPGLPSGGGDRRALVRRPGDVRRPGAAARSLSGRYADRCRGGAGAFAPAGRKR